MEHRYAFILRIWQHKPPAFSSTVSGPDPELGELRGTLQAFDSAQVHHFSSLRGLHDLLHTRLSAPPSGYNPPAPSDGAPLAR